MSYSFSASGTKAGIGDAVREAGEKQVELVADEFKAPVAEAVVRAAEHAERFAADLGDGYEGLSVSVSGHANPDRDPYAGWADECMTVSVTALASVSV